MDIVHGFRRICKCDIIKGKDANGRGTPVWRKMYMFNEMDIREELDDDAVFERGRQYERAGRVERLAIQEEGEEREIECCGVVRGNTGRYKVRFLCEAYSGALYDGDCDCPAFRRMGTPCKHIAALMIAAAESDRQRKQKREERNEPNASHGSDLWVLYMREQREREKARLRAQREAYICALLERSACTRRERQIGQEEPVHLVPVLRWERDEIELELKIGRKRMYVVRDLWEFARRMAGWERTVYGKDLTFCHSEREVCEQDIPLMRHIALLALGTRRQGGAPMRLVGAALDQTMRLLIGREVLVRRKNGAVTQARVTQGDVELELELHKAEAQTEAGGAMLCVHACDVALGDAGAYAFCGQEIRCAFGEAFDRIHGLLRVAKDCPAGLQLEREHLEAVCARVIAPAGSAVHVASGQKLLLAHTPMPMTPRFYIDMDDEDRLLCRIGFDYGARVIVPGERADDIRRDRLLEEEVLGDVQALFPERVRADEFAFSGTDEARYVLMTDRLEQLRGAGEVFVSERLAGMHVRTRRAISFGMTRAGTQLLVRADLGGYTQEDLDAAYAAYRQKRRYVRLGSGAFLSGDALEQAAQASLLAQSLGLTAQELTAGADVPSARALYIEEAVRAREGIALTESAALRDWMDRLRAAQAARAKSPASLKAQLRPYQRTGLSWLCALSDAGFGGILADDMGLGKTVQALAMILREKEAGRSVRALVVCPASLQLNWQSEAMRFAPSLDCRVLLGAAAKRSEEIARADTELLITSYDQIRRDACRYEGVAFTHVLLDEAQHIKNAASQGAKAVKSLHARHRFAMTGTPIENRLSELWSIFDFLMPGYLHAYKRFRERFEAPIVRDGDEQARANLHLMVAPFVLRRMKKDVLAELPEKVEMTLTSVMTAEQDKLYRAYASRLLEEAPGQLSAAQGRMKLLAGLTRLRQLCCDPRLCVEAYAGGSGKLTQALELVRDMVQAGHKILLFSQFTSMLALLEEALAAEGIAAFKLTGETDKRERMRMVEEFNTGGPPVFLISLKAGGTGLNLTGADVVIHYDPWWNTAAQSQATDRAYRIGQTRGVQVIDLIAAGTIEERILLLQQEKRALSDGVLLGGETLFTLDAQAMEALLRA